MAARIRAFDWTATPLGPVAGWPQSLKTAVDLMLASGHAMMLAWGPERRILYNDAYAPIMGDRHPAGLGRPLRDAWPDVWDEIAPLVERVFAGETVCFQNMPLTTTRHGEPEQSWWTFSYSPVRDEAGGIAGLLNVTMDSTAGVRADAALRESEARHRLLIESLAQAVWETDALGVVVADSPSWRAYTGQTAEEWLGYGWLDAIHPDDRPYAERQWREAVAARGLVNAEFRLRAPGGGWRWTNVRAAPMMDAAGQVEKWLGMNIDIDDRKRAEAALRESEERYRSLFNSVRQGLAINQLVRDGNGRVIDARYLELNPAYEAQTGFQRAKAIGHLASEIFPLIEPFWLEMAERVVGTGRPERTERFVADTGRWFSFDMAPFGGSDQFVVLYDDITERKRAETALREGATRQAFALRLSDALRSLDRPEEIGALAMRMIAEHLGLDRCWICQFSKEQGLAWLGPEYGLPGLPPMSGEYRLRDFPETMRPAETTSPAVADVRRDPTLTELDRASILGLGMGAYMTTILRRGDQTYEWAICASTTAPREWTEYDRLLLDAVTERVWAAMERARVASSLRESEARLAQDLEAAQVLQDIGNQLISTPGVNGHFDQLCKAARALMRSNCASIQEYDKASLGLRLVGHVGFHPDSAAFWEWVEAETGTSCGQALALGERVILPDVEAADAEPPEHEAWRRSGIRSVQSTPLVASTGEVVGMMSTHWHRPGVPAGANYRFFDILARLVADFLVRIRAEAALRESEERYRTLFETMDEGFVVGEIIRDDGGRAVDLRYLELNPAVERLVGWNARDTVGRRMSEMISAEETRAWVDDFDAILASGASKESEHYHPTLGKWFRASAAPVGPDRVALVYQNTTAQKQAEAALRESEERQAFLLRLSDALRPLADPARIQAAATTLLRDRLDAGWCYYVEWNEAGTMARVLQDATREGLPSLAGEHDVSDVPEFLDLLRTGETLNAADYAGFELLSPRIRGRYTALGFRSMLGMPLVKDGRLVATLLLGDTAIRSWSESDVALARETAERTWAAVERARAEAALRERDERNAFLVRFSDAVRELVDPQAVFQAACRLVAEKLGVERAYWAEVDQEMRDYVIGASVHAPGVPVIKGRFPVDAWEPLSSLHCAGLPVMVGDAQTDPRLPPEVKAGYARLSIGADLAVPVLLSGQLRCTLAVNQRAPRPWTPEDVALVRGIAERCWSEVERARAAAALREGEARLAAAFESAPVGVAVIDTLGAAVLANAGYRRFVPHGIVPSRDPTQVGRWKAWDAEGRPLKPEDWPSARPFGANASCRARR